MTEKLTIQDIARLAGVSVSTVSRVLNNRPDVDAATRKRVLHVMDEQGYVPNQAATNLAGGRSKIIGVAVTSLTWPFIPEIIRGIMIPTLRWQIIPEILRGVTETVGKTQYELMLYSINQPRDHSEVMRRILATKLISGLLVILPGPANKDLLKLHERGVPVVLIDDQSRHTQIPWVGTDNRHGAYMAVQHLIKLGHTRIGHIRGLYECSQERYLGYLDALEEAGIAADLQLVQQGDFEVASGREGAAALFGLANPPTAIFAANDLMAYGAMTTAEHYNLRIPEDVAIVGFDDIPFSAHVNPSLTTVRQPFYEMGEQAVQLLLSLVESSSPGARKSVFSLPSSQQRQKTIRVELASELKVRESCGTYLSEHLSSTAEISGS